MADKPNGEELATQIFKLTMIGVVLYIGAVLIFVL